MFIIVERNGVVYHREHNEKELQKAVDDNDYSIVLKYCIKEIDSFIKTTSNNDYGFYDCKLIKIIGEKKTIIGKISGDNVEDIAWTEE